jgi:murein DD-endopeptidase MepM/ murein hydrolase activator NlpD
MAVRFLLGSAALALLAGCGDFDFDLRQGGGLNTADAAARATLDRPAPDGRGVISYPTYQVAVAQQGDTIGSLATRLGLPPNEVALYNGLAEATPLRGGEIIALPRRVGDAGTTVIPGAPIDVGVIATSAIDRAPGAPPGGAVITTNNAAEPIRHQVQRGETAYTIARKYNVSVRALAEWNGLGPDLAVREGSYLIIPLVDASVPAPSPTTTLYSEPGVGTQTPVPPSGDDPLPDETTTTATNATDNAPTSPNLGGASTGKLLMPVQGSIIRGYEKKKNDGIDIGAPAGTAVKVAADGVVAAITQDTDQVPIIVVRHANDLLTVYAGIEGLTVKKGDKVSRGQTIGKVRAGNPSFLHFEVRQGFDSVDPVGFL